MSAATLVKLARRAAKLLAAGAEVPPLQPEVADLLELGVPAEQVPAILSAPARDQLRVLRLHADRFMRRQKSGKLQQAQQLAERQVRELVQHSRRIPEGVEVLPEHLAALAGVTGIDALRFVDEGAISLSRAFLRQAMASLAGTEVTAVVEPQGLRLRYGTRGGGGELFLVGARDSRGEMVLVDLHAVGMPAEAPRAIPTNGKQHQAPPGHSFLDILRDALLDVLAA